MRGEWLCPLLLDDAEGALTRVWLVRARRWSSSHSSPRGDERTRNSTMSVRNASWLCIVATSRVNRSVLDCAFVAAVAAVAAAAAAALDAVAAAAAAASAEFSSPWSTKISLLNELVAVTVDGRWVPKGTITTRELAADAASLSDPP